MMRRLSLGHLSFRIWSKQLGVINHWLCRQIDKKCPLIFSSKWILLMLISSIRSIILANLTTCTTGVNIVHLATYYRHVWWPRAAIGILLYFQLFFFYMNGFSYFILFILFYLFYSIFYFYFISFHFQNNLKWKWKWKEIKTFCVKWN